MFTSFDQFLLKQQQQQQQNGTNNNNNLGLMPEDKQQQSMIFKQFNTQFQQQQQSTLTTMDNSSFLSATAVPGQGSTTSQFNQSSTTTNLNNTNYHYHYFSVNCSTYSGETVAVTGDCNELGNWKYNLAFILEKNTSSTASNNIIAAKTNQQEQTTELWTGKLLLPINRKIKYRFFVCMILDNTNQLIENGSQQLFIMRRWESNCLPRIIDHMKTKCCLDEQAEAEPQEFGYIDMNVLKLEHGWLTSESIVQFKISNGPLRFWRKKHQNARISMKMIPLNLSRSANSSEFPNADLNLTEDGHNSSTTMTNPCSTNQANASWPLIELAIINDTEYEFKPQAQFGRIYNENEIHVFQAQVLQLENVAYMIDFYMINGRQSSNSTTVELDSIDDIPLHIGFCHILPVNLKSSVGTIIQPITGMKQESIGQIHIEYVIIKPLEDSPCDLSVSYSRHWKETWTGLDIGHRGSGNSQQKLQQCSVIRENTIASLQKAARHGADFVEFDVQLSKDLIPVLFHDFHVNIGLNRKMKPISKKKIVNQLTINGNGSGNGSQPASETSSPSPESTNTTPTHTNNQMDTTTNLLTTLRLPTHSLTISQLHELRISHEHEEPTDENILKEFEEDDDDPQLHEPFPTLESVLEIIDQHVGFNIEIKWPMRLKDGSLELENPVELNVFLDIVLKTVLKFGKKRRIVFSCFHPDICVMIRLKQNKYPVLFLTQGVTTKYPEYNDPRTQTTSVAINFALFAGILGLNMHTEDILRDPNFVQRARSHGLVTFCWGDDNNSTSTIKYLKQLGLHGVVYDRIDEHIIQKQSIFLTMTDEDNEDFLQIASGLEASSTAGST